MPKVVLISAYSNEAVGETLVEENLKTEDAHAKCVQINANWRPGDLMWATVKADDYVLWRGMDDLV